MPGIKEPILRVIWNLVLSGFAKGIEEDFTYCKDSRSRDLGFSGQSGNSYAQAETRGIHRFR
jgi:hypothetical protein